MTLNTGQPHVNEEQNRRTTTCLSGFCKMIEQINIALEQKVPNFSAWVIEACRRRLTSEKREHIHQLKVKNEHPAFFPRTGRYCKFT